MKFESIKINNSTFPANISEQTCINEAWDCIHSVTLLFIMDVISADRVEM